MVPKVDYPETDVIAARQFILKKFTEAKPKFRQEFFDVKSNDISFSELLELRRHSSLKDPKRYQDKRIKKSERLFSFGESLEQGIFCHYTCLTNSQKISSVFDEMNSDIHDFLLHYNLSRLGLL